MPAHRKVVEAFRSFPGVVTAGGDIDRAELRKLVFSGDFGVLGLMGRAELREFSRGTVAKAILI